jgi:hypothetical protein
VQGLNYEKRLDRPKQNPAGSTRGGVLRSVRGSATSTRALRPAILVAQGVAVVPVPDSGTVDFSVNLEFHLDTAVANVRSWHDAAHDDVRSNVGSWGVKRTRCQRD